MPEAEVALVVRAGDPLPPYEQVRRQLEHLIRSGTLRPGRRLPPLRQLAGDLGVAVGTLARAYRELEQAGLVVSRRAAGTRVADVVPRPAADERDAALDRLVQEFVRGAIGLTTDRAQILSAVERALPREEQALD
jgi:DNA-binding transcriptional regulator YhcF (GntR family)